VIRVVAVALLLGVPTMAAAQSSGASSWSGLGSMGLPLPQIAPPLPPIGLPLPPLGLQPRIDHFTPSRVTPSPAGRRDPGKDGRHQRPRVRPTVVYVTTPYPWFYEPASAAAPAAVPIEPVSEPSSPTGRLRFDLQPARGVQLFVDGEFVDMLDDVGAELELEAGSRRIELRADGYDPLLFDARIVGGRTITYRGSLTSQSSANVVNAPPPAPEPARRERQTFYLIPGCYLGNIPPEQVRLPAGCDLSRTIIHRP
jgi:hypothetical protein